MSNLREENTMSNLSAFLHPVQAEETREVTISQRFLGADGRPVPFKIIPPRTIASPSCPWPLSRAAGAGSGS